MGACICPDDGLGAHNDCPIHGTIPMPPDPRDAEIAALKAACAEMRAALEAEQRFVDHGSAWNTANPDAVLLVGWCLGSDESGPLREAADAARLVALSRTDLGAGMVVVPREVVERYRSAAIKCGDCVLCQGTAERHDEDCPLADLNALIKQGGG